MLMNEESKKYKTIGEVAKILTYTIRFWEKNFKQLKPRIFSGNRRYYDNKTIEVLKRIYFLLKIQGMTIKGAKKLLDQENSNLDENNNKTINRKVIETKLNKISAILKSIKKNG